MADLSAVPLEELTRDQFQPAAGTVFEIPFEDGTRHPLELVAVRDVFAGGGREGKRQPFALDFLGTVGQFVKQGTYPLEHPRLGRLEFFIVPLGPDAQQGGRIRYEAIFT